MRERRKDVKNECVVMTSTGALKTSSHVVILTRSSDRYGKESRRDSELRRDVQSVI